MSNLIRVRLNVLGSIRGAWVGFIFGGPFFVEQALQQSFCNVAARAGQLRNNELLFFDPRVDIFTDRKDAGSLENGLRGKAKSMSDYF